MPRALFPRASSARREDADAELARQHGDDTAGDTALRRQPDGVDPLAGVVVHAAGAHHAEHVLDVAARRARGAGDRVHAAVGERRRHGREVAAGDEQRALTEVRVDDRVDVALEIAEAPHQVRDGAVAIPGRALRLVHGLVELRGGDPRSGENASTMRSIRASSSRASIRPVATIAPAFTIGLNGRLRSSTTIELKALPDGSTPTCCQHLRRGRGPRAPGRTRTAWRSTGW